MNKSIKEDRLLKLKMINAVNLIIDELKKRKLKFTENRGFFEVYIKDKKLFIQTDDGEQINSCWIKLKNDRFFNLCESYLDIDEFICQLDDIIIDLDKIYKLKKKIEKHLNDIENLVNDSDIHEVTLNEGFFDEMIFENIIVTDDT